MKFIQEETIKLQKEYESILIPFYEDTDLRSRLLQLPFEPEYMEAVINRFGSGKQRSHLQQRLLQQKIMLPHQGGVVSLIFMDLGKQSGSWLDYLKEQFSCFGKEAEEDCQILLEGLQFEGYSVQLATETIIKAMYRGAYSFAKGALEKTSGARLFSLRDELKKEKKGLSFTLISSENLQSSIGRAMDYGECINYARMLGDIPNNYLHVGRFAGYLTDFAKEYKLSAEILGKPELENLHSGGILGVNAGSSEEANLITIYYEGSKGGPVTALIGKAVMFDSGGYHLKSISGMSGMKYDMCGAANVLAALEIIVRQKSKSNILMVIPAVENVISPDACKMGDVLTTMSGKTVEVYNTDAEGRLILCDAITYAIRKGADRLIDLATLTYSCQNALGDEISGIYSNNDGYYEAFEVKTREQCEKVWRLPLDEVYHKPLYRTQTADLINYAPGSHGGANVAACFLEEFVENKVPWIHLDVVGTAVNRSENKHLGAGATGVLAASIAAFLE